MRIPPNSQSGQKLRLRGRGLPGQTPGDQYIQLKIMIRSLLIGIVAGMRSLTPVAVISWAAQRSRQFRNINLPGPLSSPRVSKVALALAAAELLGDKMRSAPPSHHHTRHPRADRHRGYCGYGCCASQGATHGAWWVPRLRFGPPT